MSGNLTPRARVPMVGEDKSGPRWAAAWLAATNTERTSRDIPALQHHATLEECARLRAEDMVREGYFGHDDPRDDPARLDGKYHEILVALGFTTWSWAGENLQMTNYPDPLARAVTGLMNSPTHRANILAADFTHMGSWSAIRPENGAHLFVMVYAGVAQPNHGGSG